MSEQPSDGHVRNFFNKDRIKSILYTSFAKPQRKSAFMGVDAIIMIGAAVASAVIFSTFAIEIAGLLHGQYVNIAFSVPRYFLADGTPSTLLAVFTMLREGFFEYIFMAALVLVLIFIFTDTTKLTQNKTKTMIFRTIGMAALVLFLPVGWDPVASEIEHASLWLLNPLYSFDPAHPCIPEVSETLAPIAAENIKIVEDLKVGGIFAFDDSEGYECSPTLRVSYIFEKAVHGVSNQAPTENNVEFWENLENAGSAVDETIMMGLFGGVTKAMMLAFLMMFTTVVMLGKNLWLMSIMALFPMLAGLAIMPYIGDFAQKLIKMIPPLLMCGIITAGVILAGSSGLQMMENQINENRQMYGIPGFTFGMEGFASPDDILSDDFDEGTGARGNTRTSSPINTTTPTNQVDDGMGRMDSGILFWFMAITVLTLASLVPVMMVPELMALSGMAGQIISTGLIAGAVSVSNAVKGGTSGALRGGADAAKGVTGIGAQLKSAFTSPKTLSGMGAGFGAGVGAGLTHDVGSGLQMMPGSSNATRDLNNSANGLQNLFGKSSSNSNVSSDPTAGTGDSGNDTSSNSSDSGSKFSDGGKSK